MQKIPVAAILKSKDEQNNNRPISEINIRTIYIGFMHSKILEWDLHSALNIRIIYQSQFNEIL